MTAWLPWDPGRPCYTCGAAPSHAFPDGSPAYDHVHDATVTVLPPYPWGDPPRLELVLSDAQLAQGRAHVAQVQANAARQGLRHRSPTGQQAGRPGDRDRQLIGFLGEIAAADLTGLPWHPRLVRRGSSRAPDLGRRTEVRSTRVLGGPLKAYDFDTRSAVFLLMHTWRDSDWSSHDNDWRRWRAIGWLEGVDLMTPRHVEGEWWEAPRIHLHPLPLPGDA